MKYNFFLWHVDIFHKTLKPEYKNKEKNYLFFFLSANNWKPLKSFHYWILNLNIVFPTKFHKQKRLIYLFVFKEKKIHITWKKICSSNYKNKFITWTSLIVLWQLDFKASSFIDDKYQFWKLNTKNEMKFQTLPTN